MLQQQEAGDFSNYQLSKLLSKGKMTQRLDQLQKEMKVRNTGAVANFLDYEANIQELHAGRIMSEDTEHFVLVKNKPSTERNEEAASTSGASQESPSSSGKLEESSESVQKSQLEVKDVPNVTDTSCDIDLTEGDDTSSLPSPDKSKDISDAKSKDISDAVKSFFAKNTQFANTDATVKSQRTRLNSLCEKMAVQSQGERTVSESKEGDIEIVSNSEASEAQSTDNVEIVDVKPSTKNKNMQSLFTTAIDHMIYSELAVSNKQSKKDKKSDGKSVSESVVTSKIQDEKQDLSKENAESDDIMIVDEVEGLPTESTKQPSKMPNQPMPPIKGALPGPFNFMASMMDKLIASALSDNLEVSDDVLSKKEGNGQETIQTIDSSDESDGKYAAT